jgi:hypothetical protein
MLLKKRKRTLNVLQQQVSQVAAYPGSVGMLVEKAKGVII